MSFKKKLASLVLVGALTVGLAGCKKNHSQYSYNEKIGEDQVTFIEEQSKMNKIEYNKNILIVKKSDGQIIKYTDYADNLTVDRVDITKDGKTATYLTKADGRVMKYTDMATDLTPERIERIKKGEKMVWSEPTEQERSILNEFQTQFDGYLQKIKQTKS